MIVILVILMMLLFLGALPTWPHSSSWGKGPKSVLGLVLLVILVFALMGRI
jgi:hypothetical protein